MKAAANPGIQTQFDIAIKNGDETQVKALLDAGADPHYDEDQYIITAVDANFPKVVKHLLNAGLDTQSHRNYPIRSSSSKNYKEMVLLLLDHGNTRNYNPTIAFNALCAIGETEEAKALIKSPRVKPNNETLESLYHAAKFHHKSTVEFLISIGIRITDLYNLHLKWVSKDNPIGTTLLVKAYDTPKLLELRTDPLFNKNKEILTEIEARNTQKLRKKKLQEPTLEL